jgi:hypothetical protein
MAAAEFDPSVVAYGLKLLKEEQAMVAGTMLMFILEQRERRRKLS